MSEQASYLICGSAIRLEGEDGEVSSLLASVQQSVQALVQQGYAPCGGVTMYQDGRMLHATQAVYRPASLIKVAH